jgi:hypothetical protein
MLKHQRAGGGRGVDVYIQYTNRRADICQRFGDRNLVCDVAGSPVDLCMVTKSPAFRPTVNALHWASSRSHLLLDRWFKPRFTMLAKASAFR